MSQLKVTYLAFQQTGWGNEKKWKADARLHNDGNHSGQSKEMTIELHDDIAKQLALAVLPFFTKAASDAAQALADDAKAQANQLSEAFSKQLTLS